MFGRARPAYWITIYKNKQTQMPSSMATQCSTCMHARPLACTGRIANPLRSAVAATSQRSTARRPRVSRVATRAGLDLDWSDPDTLIGLAGAVLGITVGIGAPLFYISRDEADEKRLEELRELNRQTYKETGEYMTEVRGPSLPQSLPVLHHPCVRVLPAAGGLCGTTWVGPRRRRSLRSAGPDGPTVGARDGALHPQRPHGPNIIYRY